MPLKADNVSSYIPSTASTSSSTTTKGTEPIIPIPRMHKHAEMTQFNGTPVHDPTPWYAPYPAHFQHTHEEARDIECDRMLRRTVSAEHLVNYQRRWLLK